MAELSRRTGLYKSTLLRLTQSLKRFGYLEKLHDGIYCIGPEPLRLVRIHQQSVQLMDVLPPVMQRLVDSTGESSSYFVPCLSGCLPQPLSVV